jgi:hypothetical protein
MKVVFKPSQCLMIPDNTHKTLQNLAIFSEEVEKTYKYIEIYLYFMILGDIYMILDDTHQKLTILSDTAIPDNDKQYLYKT